jgi:hypothetical protein
MRQLRHVTVKSPVEFHSRKPDTEFADSCGFGCAFLSLVVVSAITGEAKMAAGKGFEPQNGGGATVYRFTVGCIRPLCQPAKV